MVNNKSVTADVVAIVPDDTSGTTKLELVGSKVTRPEPPSEVVPTVGGMVTVGLSVVVDK